MALLDLQIVALGGFLQSVKTFWEFAIVYTFQEKTGHLFVLLGLYSKESLIAVCILFEFSRHSLSEWSIPHDIIFSPSRS